MNAERHLLKEALIHVPTFDGNNIGARRLQFSALLRVFCISCNLPGVCGPCVLRREKLVSYFLFFSCFVCFFSNN